MVAAEGSIAKDQHPAEIRGDGGPSPATVLVIVGFALLGGVGAALLFARSDSQMDKAWTAVLTVGTAWSYIGAGLVAWRRRPDYRTGRG